MTGVRVVLWASDLTLQNDWPHEARPGHLPMGHTREDQGCPVWPLAEWLLPCKQADTFLVHGLMDRPLLATWLFEPHPLFVPLRLLPGPVSREETKHLTQNLLTI